MNIDHQALDETKLDKDHRVETENQKKNWEVNKTKG